jgi:FAD:protein FMN transferase
MKSICGFLVTALLATLIGLVALGAVAAEEPFTQPFTQHRDGVLGTSLDVVIHGTDAATAERALNAALAEIARLEEIFSTYRADSEVMQLNAARATDAASAELLDVLGHCAQWYATTEGKFSCRLGRLQTLWAEAEAKQIIPERSDVRGLARASNQATVIIDTDAHKVSLGEPVVLDPSGLATGYIVDHALALLREAAPDATAIKLDIGGDALYWGQPPGQNGWQVAVADPHKLADNANFLATLALTSKAVTASGHSSRRRTIARRDFSYILAARDGWPIENGTTSVVVADSALIADAVATTLAAQGLTEGIDWVNTLDGVEALVIDAAGLQLSSDGWSALLAPATNAAATFGAVAMTLDYTLPDFDAASYNRPYLAIWITDTEQKPLKNLLLLGETERWARENTRWWRRVGRRNAGLLDGVARPTRGPGEYQLQWDGKDDFGVVLPPGSYLLHLEASRENGGSTYKELPFAWGGTESHDQQLAPDGELGAIHLRISNGQVQ